MGVVRLLRRLLCAGVLGGCGLAAWRDLLRDALTTFLSDPASAVQERPLEATLVDLATGLAGLAVVALALSGLLTVATAGRALAPGWWRRAVLAACGLALVAPASAQAAPADHDSDVGCRSGCPVVVGGLPLPDLPEAREPASLVVRPGDSLWAIARDRLGPHAPEADVAALVQRLHDANLAAIGPDPDLIFPGTLLTVPGGTR